jgi:hypothetical protein
LHKKDDYPYLEVTARERREAAAAFDDEFN